MIAPVLPEFCALHPKVAVDLRLNDRVISIVDESIDIAIRLGVREIEIVPSSNIIVDASEAVIAAVAAGAGIGMATSFMTASLVRKKALIPVLSDFTVERHNISAVWHESRCSNPAVRAFLAFMLEKF